MATHPSHESSFNNANIFSLSAEHRQEEGKLCIYDNNPQRWQLQLPLTMRESIPRQVDKKFGGPQGERGLKEEERTHFFVYIP